jgi:hypothetical protein
MHRINEIYPPSLYLTKEPLMQRTPENLQPSPEPPRPTAFPSAQKHPYQVYAPLYGI